MAAALERLINDEWKTRISVSHYYGSAVEIASYADSSAICGIGIIDKAASVIRRGESSALAGRR